MRKARALTSEKGILALPEPKQGRKIPQGTTDTVHQFYQDDEFSYMMPGAKDRISIKKMFTCRKDSFYVTWMNCSLLSRKDIRI